MVIKEGTREQEKEVAEPFSHYIGAAPLGLAHLWVLLSAPRGSDGLGTKAKMILREAPDASFFICISNEIQRPLQYVNT